MDSTKVSGTFSESSTLSGRTKTRIVLCISLKNTKRAFFYLFFALFLLFFFIFENFAPYCFDLAMLMYIKFLVIFLDSLYFLVSN